MIGRISPESKRRVVESLRDEGRYFAMFGEGVYDVPRSNRRRLAIAQGPGTKMASSVADVVLVRGDLAAVPAMVAEGAEDRTSLELPVRAERARPAAGRGSNRRDNRTRHGRPLPDRRLEAAGRRRSTAVGALCESLADLYVLTVSVPVARELFALAALDPIVFAIALAGASRAGGGLAITAEKFLPGRR